MIYFQVIIVAVILTALAEKIYNHKIAFTFVSILSLIGPVWLAAARDLTIGYDVNLYLVRHFNLADSGMSFVSFCESAGDYFLYETVVYIATNLSHNIGFVMGTLEFITCIFFYLAACNNKHRVPMWLFMGAFYCFAYIYSLNIMKQILAISVLVYSMKFYERREWKKWLIWVLIAVLFHASSLLILLVPIVDFQMQKYSKQQALATTENEKKNIRTAMRKRVAIEVGIVIVLCLIAFLGLNSILNIMVRLNLFADRASAYLTKYAVSEINFEMYKVVLQLFWLVMIYFSRRRFLTVKGNYLLIVMLVFYFGFTLLGGRVMFLERTGLIFGLYPICAGYGQISNCLKLQCGKINLTPVVIFAIFLFSCWWQFCVCNQAAAYPYVFR